MRLIRLKPTYFRGFGDSDWINLDADLVLVYGPNGFGKTSLAEAAEWLIYGRTRRREKGNTFSRIEYRGSYRNAHAPDGVATSVSAVVRFHDGSEHVIERVQPAQRSDEDSELRIDNSLATFAELGLDVRDAFYPIIVQHGLQDFIHARPIDRRDAISSAFGLEALVYFKSAMEQARNRFRSAPPHRVSTATDHLRNTLIVASNVDCVSGLTTRWRQHLFDIDRDYDELLSLARHELGDDAVSADDVPDRLADAKHELQAAVFDLDNLLLPPNHDTLIETVEITGHTLGESLRALKTATERFLAVSASAYTEELLRFWERGLALAANRDDDRCPMCEQETLTLPKKEDLWLRLADNTQYLDALRALSDTVSRAGEATEALSRAISAITQPRLDEDQAETLRGLFADDVDVVEPVIAAAARCAKAKNEAIWRLSRIASSLRRVQERSEHSRARQRMVRTATAMTTRAESCLQDVLDAWRAYAPISDASKAAIGTKIASEASSRRIDALLQLWGARAHVRTLHVFYRLLDATLEDMQAVERHIQAKHTELFESRGADVQSWYDEMCPAADVRYVGMEAVTDAVKLHAESFGRAMAAAPCLSHSQLNCLGLGVYITRGTTPDTPFGFLVFDDPVQSMDDDHCESFLQGVVGRLLDDAHEQIIVLSHLEQVTNRLQRLHSHHRVLKYKIDEYRRTGPSIVTYDPLSTEVREIQALADGNEENRRLAVQKLRPTIERVVRELHLHETGQALDQSLARATAADLLRAFTQIPNTTPQEHQGFRDTVGFADPSHHSEDGWQVPTKPQILAHVDRLRQLARQKGLIT